MEENAGRMQREITSRRFAFVNSSMKLYGLQNSQGSSRAGPRNVMWPANLETFGIFRILRAHPMPWFILIVMQYLRNPILSSWVVLRRSVHWPSASTLSVALCISRSADYHISPWLFAALADGPVEWHRAAVLNQPIPRCQTQRGHGTDEAPFAGNIHWQGRFYD